MSGQNADANAGIHPHGADGLGASSASDSPLYGRDTDNIIDTVDQSSQADAKGHDGDDGKGGKGADGAGKEGKDGDRFDQHPRFQELNDRMKAAEERAIRAEAKLEVLDKGKGGDDKGTGADDDGYKPMFTYDDVSKMDADQIREKLEDDPKGFITNLFAQMVDETRKVIHQEQAQNAQKSTIKTTFDKFAEENPGDPSVGLKSFDEMWKSGELKSFMGKHPGHNAISAYMMMTTEAREKSVAARSEAKIKADAEKKAEEARRNKQAKDGARSLGAGPGGAPKDAGAETIKNTKAQGGLISALTQRLVSRRSADG